MQQESELGKVKLRIYALSQKTVANGCSEEEMMSAMEKVGQLLEQYDLTMDEVAMRQEKCVTKTIMTERAVRLPIDSCIVSLAAFGDCVVWITGGRGPVGRKTPKAYKIFGLEPDTQMVEYLYHVIKSAIDAESAKFKQSDAWHRAASQPRGYRKNMIITFGRSMAARIHDRLEKMKEERDAELAALRSTGTALILIKGQLVTTECKKTHGFVPGVSHANHSRRNNWEAASAGSAAGDRVNLKRAIGSEGRNQLLLK